MSDDFIPVAGKHFVTVPAGNTSYPQLVGVRGQLVASKGEVCLVRFDEHDGASEISAFDLVEFGDGVLGTAAQEIASERPDSNPSGISTADGPRLGIYFGTETGNTEDIAERLRNKLSDCNVSGYSDIDDCPIGDLLNHDVILLGVSTWNIGDIQYSWEEKLDEIEAQDYSGIKVAIFGLGDAAGYPDTFVDGMGILWDRMKHKGAELIGVWPKEGYDFDASRGMFDDDHFLGLVIDEDGESQMTPERIDQWVEQLRHEIGLPVLAEVQA